MRNADSKNGTLSLTKVVEAGGSLSAGTAVRGALERSKAASALNAFITINEKLAIAAAATADNAKNSRLPLRGATLAVKDNIHVHGLPNTAGTPSLRYFMPPDTSPVVERLQSLGVVVLGKTGLHELAYGITSNNSGFGAVRNPLDQTRIPGGSSGGNAAAVAAGIVTIGIGTDTGGSVRLPAAMTGTVGFRPTVGLYPADAVTLISNTRDTLGVMARTVEDTALLHAFIVDELVAAPATINGLRLGVPYRHFREMLDPEVEEVFAKFLAKLEAAGAVLVEADLADVAELNEEASLAVCLYETGQLLPSYLARYKTGVTVEQLIAEVASPDVSLMLGAAVRGAISEDVYQKALDQSRPALQRAYVRYFESYDVGAVVFPTSPLTARPIEGITDGVIVQGQRRDTFPTYIRNTDPASNAGIPALSLPAGRTADGLAVGAEFECLAGQDRKLLSIALAVEAALAASPITSTEQQQRYRNSGKRENKHA